MANGEKVCRDCILPTELFRAQRTIRRRRALRAVFEFRKMWINGSTLRIRFLNGSPDQRRIATEQALWWTQHANLRFEFGDFPEAEIRVAFNSDDGAWSYVGTDCRKVASTEATMNLGFLEGGTAGHEFGHAIGLGHEHQNPAGGIEWNEQAVIRDLSGPPNYWSEAQIRHNVLDKYKVAQIRGSRFDPDSIMLYFFPDSWVKDGKGTKANEVLSSMDKAFIAGRDAYPRKELEFAQVEVGAWKATKAAIGKAGEEDVFQFEVGKAGRHIVRTRGDTDVVMKLFGPEDLTRLIAEDDDSGIGLNARIVADLVPGVYFIQVRHYRTRTGTGAYTLRVDRS